MRHVLNGRLAGGSVAARQLVAGQAAIALTVALLAVLAGAPSVALAGSLLSGYGDPGEGSQAVLGSALLNAPSGGSGSGTSSGGGSATSSGGGSANIAGRGLTSPSTANHEGAAPSESSVSAGRARPTTVQPAPATGGSHGAATARATSRGAVFAVPASDRAVGSQALGLTLADLLYALLALAALAAIWALTAVLARARANETVSGAKGTAPRIRLKP